jgi:hypothetical protein
MIEMPVITAIKPEGRSKGLAAAWLLLAHPGAGANVLAAGV